MPLASPGRAFTTARAIRAHLQRTLPEHLRAWPERAPLDRLPPAPTPALSQAVTRRWTFADAAALNGTGLRALPIDHTVAPAEIRGGTQAARDRLTAFVAEGLSRYVEDHSQPERDATSRLSPWLHFGHISVHEIFSAVASRERWTTRRLNGSARGAREGWWKMSGSAEAFLDELITWRELAFNTCEFLPDYRSFDSLPDWARSTLDRHRRDRRIRYEFDVLDDAATHDELWNAVQRQLRRDGWFHGYMRMLWGKKILEWSATPEAALDTMERLMNRYSLDGRDPNSWAGYTWVLGRYDRPWPEREIFGTVRYMSSANTARKLRVKNYMKMYGR
jgi:deoxyribodipyrimidine photo-lyase